MLQKRHGVILEYSCQLLDYSFEIREIRNFTLVFLTIYILF